MKLLTLLAFGLSLQMVQAREMQLNQNENECKLEQVQIRFPHDLLHLFQPLDIMEVRVYALECVCVCVCVCAVGAYAV